MTVEPKCCSFCEKPVGEVRLMFGSSPYICDECVSVCVEVLGPRELPPHPDQSPPKAA